ncbi:MAG: LacI family DNA-binding transcriptional regulator, partial [Chloroflexota bacterium]
MTTISEIAANLGVTAATVSRALNAKPGVSAALRATIWEEAARLNFVANGAARSLR